MIFVGFPMYRPPSFLSPFPKITKKKFISGLTFSLTLLPSDWFGSLKPPYKFLYWCAQWIGTDSLLSGPELVTALLGFPVGHFSAVHFKRCWVITASFLSSWFSLLCCFQPCLPVILLKNTFLWAHSLSSGVHALRFDIPTYCPEKCL